VGHFYKHHSDGKRLQEHFDFAGSGGGKVDAAGFGDMSQDGDIDFPEGQHGSHRPVDDFKGEGRQVKKLRLTDYCEADKGAADKDFINKGVYHSSKLAGNI
jgi:hypothetical protein